MANFQLYNNLAILFAILQTKERDLIVWFELWELFD